MVVGMRSHIVKTSEIVFAAALAAAVWLIMSTGTFDTLLPWEVGPPPATRYHALDPAALRRPARIAVCISGGARTLPLVLPSLVSNVIDALQPDPAMRHLFFELSTVSDCAVNSNNKGVLRECNEWMRRSAEWIGDGSVLRSTVRAASVEVNIVNNLTCSHPFARSHRCCRREPRAMNHDGPGVLWGMTQYVRRNLCYQRIKEYQASHAASAFDLIVWTRPDMFFTEPIPPASYFRSLHPRIFAMSKEGTFWGDYLFVAPLALADEMDALVSWTFDATCKALFLRSNPPETELGKRLEKSEAHHKWPFQAVIRRSPEAGDCGRLQNDVLSMWYGSTATERNGSTAIVGCQRPCDAAARCSSDGIMKNSLSR